MFPLWILSLALSLSSVGCFSRSDMPRSSVRNDGSPSAREAADQVLVAVRDRDGGALASLVHPENGVRFSPSAFVDASEDRVFLPSEVALLWDDNRKYRWGYAEGSGDPIDLAPRDYFATYVLVGSQDFTRPTLVNVNDDRAVGTTANNAAEVYPGATRVEYFVEPINGEAGGGADWVALRLVFERNDGRWWLVGVIHDAWSP